MAEDSKFNLSGALEGAAVGFGAGLSGQNLLPAWLEDRRERLKQSRFKQGQRGIAAAWLKDPAAKAHIVAMAEGAGITDATDDDLADFMGSADPAEFGSFRTEVHGAMDRAEGAANKAETHRSLLADTLAYAEETGAPIPAREDGWSDQRYASEVNGRVKGWEASTAQSRIRAENRKKTFADTVESFRGMPAAQLLAGDAVGVAMEAFADEVTQSQQLDSPEDQADVIAAKDNALRALNGYVYAARQQEIKGLFGAGIFDQRYLTINGQKKDLSDVEMYEAGYADEVKRLTPVWQALVHAGTAGVTLDGNLGDAQAMVRDANRQYGSLSEVPMEARGPLMNALWALDGAPVVAQATTVKLVDKSKDVQRQSLDRAMSSNNIVTLPGWDDFASAPHNFTTDESGLVTGLSERGAIALATQIGDEYLTSPGEADALAGRFGNSLIMPDGAFAKFRSNLVLRGAKNQRPNTASEAAARNPVVGFAQTASAGSTVDYQQSFIETADMMDQPNEREAIWRTFGPVVYPSKFTRNIINRQIGETVTTLIDAAPPETEQEWTDFYKRVRAMGPDIITAENEASRMQRGERAAEAVRRKWYGKIEKQSSTMASSGTTIDTAPVKKEISDQIFHSISDMTRQSELARINGQLTSIAIQKGVPGIDTTDLAVLETQLALQQKNIVDEQDTGYGAAFRRSTVATIVELAFNEDWDEETALEKMNDLVGSTGVDLGKRLRGQQGTMDKLKEAESPLERLAIIQEWYTMNPDALLSAGPTPGGKHGEIAYGLFIQDITALRAAALDYGAVATPERMDAMGWGDEKLQRDKDWGDDQTRGLHLIRMALRP